MGRTVALRLISPLHSVVTHNPKALFLALVIIASALTYSASILMTEARYRLSDNSLQLIGGVNKELAKKVSLDKNLGAYRFNAENISPEMTGETDPAKVATLLASQKQQTGGGGKDTKNLYSLDMPIDPKKGTTIYDGNSKTSLKIIPQFAVEKGRSEEGRVVYPLEKGGQAIYSIKGNGVKEDIVLSKPRGDELSFTYKLELPKSLEARLDSRGNLGIYSVDPAVSEAVAGALQAGGSSTDTERLKDIQENGSKDFLTYLIPAPTIIQSGDQPHGHSAKAAYKLNGDILTVEATGLEKLTYPISIDPSVVVTSTSDFAAGNNEGNISYDTDAISTGVATNGTVGAWTATTSFTNARSNFPSVAYNGYLYIAGGSDGSGGTLADVRYAPLNNDGTVGAWTATNSLNRSLNGHSLVAYNGYLYAVAGFGSSGTIEYAPINADGSVGTWTNIAVGIADRFNQTSLAYNGYLYIIGGDSGIGSKYADVQYAPINANGSTGTWTATSSFTTARSLHGSAVYNGYMYVVGGMDASNTRYADVQYAPINADGTVGTWRSSTSLSAVRANHGSFVYSGYLYVTGGQDSTGARLADAQYALINADGSVGAWTATSSFATARYGHGAVAYNGYLYVLGGSGASGALSDVQYAKIDAMSGPSMTMPSWTTSSVPLGLAGGSPSSKISNRRNHTSVAYNGYLYVFGGTTTTSGTNSVQSAPINADGTLGAWVARATLPAIRQGHSSVVVNGYVYILSGQDNVAGYTTTIYYAALNSDGTVGTWTTNATAMTIPRSNSSAFAYNGYVYMIGGLTTGNAMTNTVSYAPINANNSIGTWMTTTALPAARAAHTSVFYNGYIYVLGGNTTSWNSDVLYAHVNTDGTLGTWATTTSMTSARGYFSAELYDGHIFVFGGYPGSSQPDVNTTSYAKINSDGTVGAWMAGTTFTSGREAHATAIYNGTVYLAGGYDSGTTYYTDIQYVKLTYARSGPLAGLGTTNTWQTTTSSNLAIYGQSAVIYGNYIYIVGGYGTSYLNSVRYAPINANGTIGSWTTSANVMTMARFNVAAVAYKGYLYATGGQQAASTFTNTVEYAPINADGSIGTWTASSNTVTTARYGHMAAAYNGKLYVVGGGDAANTALGDVKYATINADGSIGAFANTTATTPDRDTDGFIYGGRMYVLGGVNGTVYSSTVRYATINADGTLGAWTTSYSEFAGPRSRLAAVASNGYVYISGGGATAPYGDLQYAQINADGSIGTWKTSTSLSSLSGAPAGYYYHSMLVSKGRLYSLAGADGTATAQAASYMTTTNAPDISAVYSKQINLGSAGTVNSVVANGTLPVDQTNIWVRTAGTNGVYGSWQPLGSLSLPLTNVQYVMYKVVLDDSRRSDLFSATGRSSVTDITVDYTLPATLTPDNRLRHNKYFDTSGVLQPLQTQ